MINVARFLKTESATGVWTFLFSTYHVHTVEQRYINLNA